MRLCVVHGCQQSNLKKNVKGTEWGKMKGLKPKHLSSWSRPILFLSDVPVSRNWYKTVS